MSKLAGGAGRRIRAAALPWMPGVEPRDVQDCDARPAGGEWLWALTDLDDCFALPPGIGIKFRKCDHVIHRILPEIVRAFRGQHLKTIGFADRLKFAMVDAKKRLRGASGICREGYRRSGFQVRRSFRRLASETDRSEDVIRYHLDLAVKGRSVTRPFWRFASKNNPPCSGWMGEPVLGVFRVRFGGLVSVMTYQEAEIMAKNLGLISPGVQSSVGVMTGRAHCVARRAPDG